VRTHDPKELSRHERRSRSAPARPGCCLSALLAKAGIETAILERRSPGYVLGRIRAGVLEQVTVDLLDAAGAGARMHAEGLPHAGIELCFGGKRHRIDFHALTGGKQVMVYGQTEVTRDLMDLRAAQGLATVYEVEDVGLHDIDGAKPVVRYTHGGVAHELVRLRRRLRRLPRHQPAKRSAAALSTYERVYPFGWLGVLSETPPVSRELIYSNHARGFALCSMRSMTRSRYYVQCPIDDDVERWSDDAFWAELRLRLDHEAAQRPSPARRSRRASRRCAASSPSRCASAALFSPASGTSCRRPALRD
jgi:p-hydroxybenzoate 3-monooxygenase